MTQNNCMFTVPCVHKCCCQLKSDRKNISTRINPQKLSRKTKIKTSAYIVTIHASMVKKNHIHMSSRVFEWRVGGAARIRSSLQFLFVAMADKKA